MASLANDWLTLHDQTEAKIVDLSKLLAKSDRTPRTKRDIRNAGSIVTNNIKVLEEALEKSLDRSSLGEAEFERRRVMLQDLKDRALFTQAQQKAPDPSASVSVPIETPDIINQSNEQLIRRQEDDLRQHDEKLDVILSGVGRLKNMGEDINAELLLHAELLNDLDRGMDGTHRSLIQGSNRATLLMKNDSSCTGLFIIFALLMLIVVLLVL